MNPTGLNFDFKESYFPLPRVDDPRSSVEYLLPPEDLTFQPEYLATVAPLRIDSIYITIDGREIEVMGISEEQEAEEFDKGLDKLVRPVVLSDDLKAVLDRHLFLQLNQDLEEFPYNQEIFLQHLASQDGPLELKDKEALREEILKLPIEERKYFKPTLKVLDKSISIFETLQDPFLPLEKIKQYLGEEIYKKNYNQFPIKWKLPKESLPKFFQSLEFYISDLYLELTLPDLTEEEINEIKRNKTDEEQRLRRKMERFKVVKDHYVEADVFPFFIPFTKMPLMPWPRMERLKQALRNYFRIEKCLKCPKEETSAFFAQLRASDQREAIVEQLQHVFIKEERVKLLEKLDAKGMLKHLSREEKLTLYETLLLLLPIENEMLLTPCDEPLSPEDEPFTDPREEAIAYLTDLTVRYSIEERKIIVERLSREHIQANQLGYLKKFDRLNRLQKLSEDQKLAVFQMLLLFLPLNNEPVSIPIKEPCYEQPIAQFDWKPDLFEIELIEEKAFRSLDTLCTNLGLRIKFLKRGRPVEIGSIKMG